MHKLHLVKVSFRNKEKSISENNHFILIRTEKKKKRKPERKILVIKFSKFRIF